MDTGYDESTVSSLALEWARDEQGAPSVKHRLQHHKNDNNLLKL